MNNIKHFIDFSLFEAKTNANNSKDYLSFNGNKLEFIENGKVTKSWIAVSGRTYYHWYMKPAIWNKRYTMSPEQWAKVKNEGPTPPGLYTLGATQHRDIDTKWKTDPNYVKKRIHEELSHSAKVDSK
jgi:hypothetical protein